MKERKVIGIGWHKTGTTTLDIALKTLGYKVLGSRIDLASYLLNENIDPVLEIADKYDAYQDNPWPLLYKELDRRYPKSKFILTIRDESKWIKSAVNHFGSSHTDMRKWIYGIGHPKGNEEIYLERYRKHNEEVLQYFKDRKDDLLIIEWAKGDEWQKLCDFLDEPIPEAVFPHANKGNYSGNGKTSISYYKTLIKKTIKRIFK